jgi:XTP/dITP diphosphohydrolase
MNTIILATTNTHKVDEMNTWLASQTLPVAIQFQLMPIPLNVEETGLTFMDNALLKAQTAQRLLHASTPYQSTAPCKTWVLAEDSGFAVDALAGTDGLPEFPGVHSNRWLSAGRRAMLLRQPVADTPITDIDRCHALWALLDFLKLKADTARYCCAMVALPLHQTTAPVANYSSYGTMDLVLNTQDRLLRGKQGFGYDPMVYPVVAGKKLLNTVAELNATQKNLLSHRGKALKAIIEQLVASEMQAI